MTGIKVDGRVYHRNTDVDRYQIPVSELSTLAMRDVPPHSHLEILDLPLPKDALGAEVYALNNGQSLSVYGGVDYKVPETHRSRTLAKFKKAFPDLGQDGFFSNPGFSTRTVDDGVIISVFMSLEFTDNPEMAIRDAVTPFLDGFKRLGRPTAHVFVCHASEDKPTARLLAVRLKEIGSDVWFDEWEIQIGDSIVQKINEALGQVSHLVVLLSQHSVEKPWVKREMSAALMQQLSQNEIRLLPVRLDDCEVPPIISDLKYAHLNAGLDSVMEDIEKALFPATLKPDMTVS